MYSHEPGMSGGPERFETPRLEDLAAEAVNLYDMVTELEMQRGATELNFTIVHAGINAAFFEENEEQRAIAAERFAMLENVLPHVPLSADIMGVVTRNFDLASVHGGELAETAERILGAIPEDRHDLQADLTTRLAVAGNNAAVARATDTVWRSDIPVAKKIARFHELDRYPHIDTSPQILALTDLIRDPLEASRAVINYGQLPVGHVKADYVEHAVEHIDRVDWQRLEYGEEISTLIRFDERSAYIVQLAGLYRLTGDQKYKDQVADMVERISEDDRLAINYKAQVVSRVADVYPMAPEEIKRLSENDPEGLSNLALQRLAEAYIRQRDLMSADYYADRINTLSMLYDTRRRMVEIGRWTSVFVKLLEGLDSNSFPDSRLRATTDTLTNSAMYGESYALQERIQSLPSRSNVITILGRTMAGNIPRTQDLY